MKFSKLKQWKDSKYVPKSRVVLLDYNDLLSPIAPFFIPAVIPDIVLKEGKKDKPEAVIMWNDILPDYQMLCKLCALHEIPTFVLQHGRGAARDYLNGSTPMGNAFFAWGTEDEAMAKVAGFKNVFRVGFPGFALKPQKKEEKGTVIFDAVHWDQVIDENVEAWDALRKIDSIKPVAKLLKAQGPNHDPSRFPGLTLTTDQTKPGHLKETYELVSKASAVVCLIEGTLELLAYSLDVPVIHLNTLKMRSLLGRKQDTEDYEPTKAAARATIDTLKEVVENAVAHPEQLRQERREIMLMKMGDPDKDTPFATITKIVNTLVAERK